MHNFLFTGCQNNFRIRKCKPKKDLTAVYCGSECNKKE